MPLHPCHLILVRPNGSWMIKQLLAAALMAGLLPPAQAADQRLNPQAIQRLQQHKSDKNSYRFVVTGDNRDGDSIFLRILREAAQHQPRFMLHTGDFVSTGTYSQYQRFIGYLRPNPYPVLPVVGNHEVYQGGRKWYNQFFGPSYFAFTYGPDHYIFVDNADAKVSPGQLQWLEQQLQQKHRYTFVVMHMPPRNIIWFHAFGDGARPLMNLVEKYRANYVLMGHIHIYDKMVSNGVNYIVSGGAGAPLYRMPLYISPEGGAFSHYLLMHVSPEGIREEVVPLR